MTPDTCPYCGAPIHAGVSYPVYACRTVRTRDGSGKDVALQSPECARYVRTRISQLKRMADAIGAWVIMAVSTSEICDLSKYALDVRKMEKLQRLHGRILREIDRLRGGA